MGLDMYLSRAHNEKEVCYWRKAYAVRNFIKDKTGADDSQLLRGVFVKREVLEELVEKCELVIKKKAMGCDTLPTECFLFRETLYDEIYLEKIKYTKTEIKKVLRTYKDKNFLYHDSW